MGSPEEHAEGAQDQNQGDADVQNPPPRPQPEADAGIIPPIKSPEPQALEGLTAETVNIFELEAVAALRLLCRNVEALVSMTGDVPPTPPVRSRGTSPSAPSHSRTSSKSNLNPNPVRRENLPLPGSRNHDQQIDGVPLHKTPMGSPEAHPSEPTAIYVGNNAQPLHIQHGALARKFYSKRPPPISLEDYLMRMHKYCPMSTAVYLAASYYITQLAAIDKILPVTPRNVHRLILAGLRVAMKALEDLSWPHSRFSKVGGVSEIELGRLEITFCFLMDFTLKVDEQMLQREAESLCRTATLFGGGGDSAVDDGLDAAANMQLRLPDRADRNRGQSQSSVKSTAEKRKASSSLPMRPVPVEMGIGIVGQS